MRKAALAALLLVLVPLQAQALDTKELLGLVAMPLAVAAASEVTGVPVEDLSHFVATLNRAQVPPTQFVQVVRYAPAALVVEEPQPGFVAYVDSQVDEGVTGSHLVTVIEDRYETYDLEPQFVPYEEAATTYVVRDDYIPQVVVTRVAQVRPANDLLALAAMPLAVAAVAEMTGIPFNELSNFVATLNAAEVAPLQIVEVLRYTPAVFVDATARPEFVQYVSSQFNDGVTGVRLVNVIDDRLRTYDVTPQFGVPVAEVVNVVDQPAFFPAAVTSRVAQVRAHPHGGPPGQVKKQRGVQTGAEVVHGTRRVARKPARVERPHVETVQKVRVAKPQRVEKVREVKPQRVEKVHGSGGGEGKSQGQGHGKGKGKGKG
jgi:hypothetical protein